MNITRKYIIKQIINDFDIKIPIIHDSFRVMRMMKRKGSDVSKYEQIIAAVYIVLKSKGNPVSFLELIKYAQKKGWKVRRRAVYFMIKNLIMKTGAKVPTTDPALFIESYAKKLGFSEEEIEEAKNIAKDFAKLRGKIPRIIALASLYIVAIRHGREITQEYLARMFKTTEVSIRKYVRLWREIKAAQQKPLTVS